MKIIKSLAALAVGNKATVTMEKILTLSTFIELPLFSLFFFLLAFDLFYLTV